MFVLLKNIVFSVVVCLVLACDCYGQSDSKTEPPLTYDVKIGDKTIIVDANQTFTVQGSFKDPEIRITPGKIRRFPYMGIEFEYPAGFNFEADFSDGSKTWTLSGNSLTVMIFELETEMTTVAFSNSMIASLGKENARITEPNITQKFGSLEFPGSRLVSEIGTTKLQLDVMKLPSESGKTKLFIFQDTLEDSGNHSNEARKVMPKIKSTFKFSKK